MSSDSTEAIQLTKNERGKQLNLQIVPQALLGLKDHHLRLDPGGERGKGEDGS